MLSNDLFNESFGESPSQGSTLGPWNSRKIKVKPMTATIGNQTIETYKRFRNQSIQPRRRQNNFFLKKQADSRYRTISFYKRIDTLPQKEVQQNQRIKTLPTQRINNYETPKLLAKEPLFQRSNMAIQKILKQLEFYKMEERYNKYYD